MQSEAPTHKLPLSHVQLSRAAPGEWMGSAPQAGLIVHFLVDCSATSEAQYKLVSTCFFTTHLQLPGQSAQLKLVLLLSLVSFSSASCSSLLQLLIAPPQPGQLQDRVKERAFLKAPRQELNSPLKEDTQSGSNKQCPHQGHTAPK